MTFVYPRPISPADPRCASPVRGAGSLIPEISGVERTSGRQHAGPDGDSRDGQNTPRLGCLVPAEACARGAHLSSSSLSSPTERSRPTDRRCEKTGLSQVGQSLPHSSHSLSPVWAAALEAETKDLIATSHYLNQNKDAITMGINLRLIDDPNTPTALYRYFDEQRRLLYIGITGDLALREQGHISASKWAELVASSTVARYPDRRAALEAERAAIKAECPIFNKQYNDTPAARRRLSAYLDEVGRLDLLDRRRRHVPMGELEMAQARRAPAVVACEHGPCREDEESGDLYHWRAEVWHLLDSKDRPVCSSGLTEMHLFDGEQCTEIYLYSGEARELAASLIKHADEAAAPRMSSASGPLSTVTASMQRRRQQAS